MNQTPKFFSQWESFEVGKHLCSMDQAIKEIPWNDQGLIPVISQDVQSKAILMLAWMNETALRETIQTRQVCFWSRSRQALWRKGETSGQTQHLINLFLDCDGDTLLLEVKQKGAACHTGRKSCFYHQLDEQGLRIHQPQLVDPNDLYPNN